MIYIGVLTGMLLTSGISNKRIRLKKKYEGRDLFIIFWGVVLFLLVALRSNSVGRDTSMYELIFQRTFGNRSLTSFLSAYGYTEYAYYILEYCVSRIADYRVFVAVVALISVAPVIYVIYKYSENVVLSFLLYFCFPYYTFCMSGMRQAAAMGCIALAYHFVKQKKLPLFIVMCVLGALFHSSAILFIPVYWIDKIPYKKLTIIISTVLIGVGYVFRATLWSIATLFARQQYTGNEAGGQMMYLFMILSVVLGFIFRKNFIEQENHESNKVLLYLQILVAIIWPIASINSATFRMYYYYHMFMILYVPSLLKSIPQKALKSVVFVGYVFVALYFLYSQILPVEQGYNPYTFFWQI